MSSSDQFARPMRIYVSSTSEDLKDYRRAVIAAIRQLDEGRGRYLVVAMEDYSSQDVLPAEKCCRDVASCDAYVGLFAWRYGFIPPGHERSITELEYRQAAESGLTVLPFLVDEDVPWTRRFIDGGENELRVKRLRDELLAGRLCKFFTGPDSLARDVVTSLLKIPWPPPSPPGAQAGPSATDETSPERWLGPYLNWLEARHATLELIGVRQASRLPVPLEKVYVALRGDRTGAYELVQSRELLLEELEEQERVASWEELPLQLRRQLQAKYLRDAPYMLSLQERDRPAPSSAGGGAATVTLAEAFRKERWLVILGDPGSGKTTLARWLALKLARAMKDALAGGDGRVRVPANQVNPEMPYDRREIDLGPARLPILLRVAEFAQAQAEAQESGAALPLLDWLPRVRWQAEAPTWQGQKVPEEALARLFRSFLEQGRAVVILDGLDEITEASERGDVVRTIEQFLRDWVSPTGQPARTAAEAPHPGQLAAEPHRTGGNQLLVTSRIAGYHAAPLTAANLTHVTIEPMRRPAVEHFCDAWMQAVHAMLLPNDPPQRVQRKAAAQAEGLKRAIFDPERPGVAEIASNPLLVTILALLYQKNQGRLPGSRAQLYQTAIEALIEDWRDSGLSAEQTLYVLPPLAAFIHETSPTGLIQEADVERILTQHLAAYQNVSPDSPPPNLRESVRRFLGVLREQVGLLAARGQDLYGFLHLTFQEYLAARHLLASPAGAVPAMLARLGDARWREPLLLALGYAAWKWPSAERARLFEDLLDSDDPLGNLLPRAALLLVDALADIRQLPDAPYRKAARRLLAAYCERETVQRFRVLRHRIEDALLRLRLAGPAEVMDEVLCEALSRPGEAPAAAAIVRDQGWFTAEIVEALPAALEHDSPAWGWPAEQCLRDLVSPDLSGAAPPQPMPLDQPVREARERLRKLEKGELLQQLREQVAEDERRAPQLRQKREELSEREEALSRRFQEAKAAERPEAAKRLHGELTAIQREQEKLEQELSEISGREFCLQDILAGGERTREVLLKRAEEAEWQWASFQAERPLEAERAVKRYRKAVAGYERHQMGARLRVRAPLALLGRGLRRALEERPELVDFATGDPRWLGVLTCLAGGYANHRGDESHLEYWQLARFLSRPDDEREALIDQDQEFFAGRWGNGDIVYNAAVYLDTGMGGRVSLSLELPCFSPAALYRDSALGPLVLEALEGRRPPQELAEGLARAWREGPTRRARSDALACLVALGEDVTEFLEQALADAGRRADAEAALDNLARLAEFLREPVCRAHQSAIKGLTALREPDPGLWVDIVEAVLMPLVRSEAEAVNTAPLLQSAPPDYGDVLAADSWFRAFNAAMEVLKETNAVLLAMPESEELIALLASAWRAPNRRWGRLPLPWEVEPVPPRFARDAADVPIEALAALEALHLSELRAAFETDLYSEAVARLARRARLNPDLQPELLAFAVAFGCWEKAFGLAPGLFGRCDPFPELLTRARASLSPWHRARALLRLAGMCWGADQRQLLVEEALTTVPALAPAQRVRAVELAVPFCREQERDSLVARGLAAAAATEGAEERCRALVRLARWTAGDQRQAAWRAALQAAAAIPDEGQRAETLWMIGPFLPDGAELAVCWRRAVEGLSSARARARAAGRLAAFFLREPPPSLAALVSEAPSLWAPVLLASAVHEVLDRFRHRRGPAGLWEALAANPGEATVAALLEAGRRPGLVLTQQGARAVGALLRAGCRQSLLLLLPLLQAPAPEAVPLVQTWLTHPDPLVKHHATLLMAEDGRKINAQTLPGLVWLLEHGPDRSAARAYLVLASRVWNVRKPSTLSITRIGAAVREQVARLEVGLAQRDVRVGRAFSVMSNDWLHDDPAALGRWAEGCARGRPGHRECRAILGRLSELAPPCWPVFRELLAGACQPAAVALLQSFCVLLAGDRKLPSAELAPTLQALRQRRPEEFADVLVLAQPKLAVVAAALAALEAEPLDAAAAAQAAEGQLRASATSLEALLRGDDADLADRLTEVGNTFLVALDGSDREAEAAAARVAESPDVFPVLVHWLLRVLQRGDADDHFYQKTEAVLTVVSTAARHLPSAFVRLADARAWEPLLERVVNTHEHLYGRRAGVVLLSYLRRATPRVARALLAALRDDRLVQDAAFRAIGRLNRVSGNVMAPLLEGLQSDSAVVAYGAARMLSVVGRYEKASTQQRQQVLEALAAALRHRRSHQGVYRFTGTGDNEENPVNLLYDGRLDHALYEAILEITGMV